MMDRYPLIFSDEKRYRIKRHVLFWLCWWAFSAFLYSFSAPYFGFSYLKRLPISAFEAVLYLVPHMFLSYSLMYFIIPRMLLKGRYVLSLVSVLLLFLITASFATTMAMYVIKPAAVAIFGPLHYPDHIDQRMFFRGLLAGLRGGISIGGIAAAIKLTKYWVLKEQRILQLQQENTSSQLQLLKAQVHPHFLFNTLNNIYSRTQVTSPEAAKMIMGLSGMLRYMLYDCNNALVPLSRELQITEQYILLEKSRYGSELDVNIELPSTDTGLLIAPLLLLPFVENCFKHGASEMLEQPWISMQVTVDGEQMKMKLLNGKMQEEESRAGGIGLVNVKKRLDLVYPGKHELVINNEEEVFIVNLSIELEKGDTHPLTLPTETKQTVYA